MKKLNGFKLTCLSRDGEEVLDGEGYPVISGMDLSFEDESVEQVRFADDATTDTWAETLQPFAKNIIQSDDCVVSEDDEPWLQWFMGLVEVEEVDEPMPTIDADIEMPEVSEQGPEVVGGEDEPELGESDDGSVVGSGKVVKTAAPKRKGSPGCKHPTQVKGWAMGRILSVSKTHRGRGWGKCYYQVECIADGAYKLNQFKGNRDDIEVGQVWPTASDLFRSLMGDPVDAEGRRTKEAGKWQQGHRMTIKRWFQLGKKAKKKEAGRQ